jgi:hypothetical protein
MLLRIPIEAIPRYADLIRDALRAAAPPFVEMTERKEANVLRALEEDQMAAWIVVFSGKGVAIALTKIVEDACMETRELLIYCAYSIEGGLTAEMWDDCFKQMAENAVRMGCASITAYTAVERIKKMAMRMGGNIDTVYLNIPLGVKT